MKGSKAMAYDSANLATPDIKWLGVRPTDLDRYRIPAQARDDHAARRSARRRDVTAAAAPGARSAGCR